MQPQGLDLVAIINQGAIATYPLILLSIISVTVVFERLWSLRNLELNDSADRRFPARTAQEGPARSRRGDL